MKKNFRKILLILLAFQNITTSTFCFAEIENIAQEENQIVETVSAETTIPESIVPESTSNSTDNKENSAETVAPEETKLPEATTVPEKQENVENTAKPEETKAPETVLPTEPTTPTETVVPTEPTVEPTKEPTVEGPVETIVPTEKPVETVIPTEKPLETEKSVEITQQSQEIGQNEKTQNAQNVELVTIKINYLYESNNTQVFTPYIATMPVGTSFVNTVDSPVIPGFDPWIKDEQGQYVDGSSIKLNFNSGVSSNVEYTVLYRPALVNYSVKYFFQNI